MVAVYVLCAAFSPVLACIWAISQFNKSKRVIPTALAVAAAMTVVSLSFQALDGDLTRYIPYVEKYSNVSFADSFNLAYGNYPITTVWFWICAKLGDARLVQHSSCFICYFCLMYLLLDACKERQFVASQVWIAVLVAFALFPFTNVLSAVRSSPALAIGMMGVYLSAFKDRVYLPLALSLIVASCLTHASGYVMAFLFVVLLFLQRRSKGLSRYSLLLWAIASIAIIPFLLAFGYLLSSITSSLNVDVIEKLAGYSEWSTSWAETVANSGFYTVLKYVHLLFAAAIVIECVIRSMRVKHQDYFRSQPGFFLIMLFLLGIEIGLLFSVTVPSYLRFTYVACPYVAVFIASHAPIQRMNEKGKDWELHSSGTLPYMPFTFLMYLVLPGILALLYLYGARRIIDFFDHIMALFLGIIPVIMS